MKVEKVTKSASYYAPDATLKAEDRWKSATKDVELNIPETVDEALEVLQKTEGGLVKAASLLIRAQAEADLTGAIPETAFTQSQVAAISKAFRAMPQFSGLKSKDLKVGVMNWIVESGTTAAMLSAFAPLRATAEAEDE